MAIRRRDGRGAKTAGITPADLLRPSVLALVVANLVPLYGVLALGWEVFPLIFLFWLENVVIGIFNVFRMIAVPPYDRKTWGTKAFLVPFFCLHYGLFTAGHGAFVLALFGGNRPDGAALPGPGLVLATIGQFGLAVPAAMLVLSHGFSYLWNFLGQGEFRRTGLDALMGRPYGRIVLLHVTLILGGAVLQALGSPIAGLCLFLVLKIGFDLRAHLRDHVGGKTAQTRRQGALR